MAQYTENFPKCTIFSPLTQNDTLILLNFLWFVQKSQDMKRWKPRLEGRFLFLLSNTHLLAEWASSLWIRGDLLAHCNCSISLIKKHHISQAAETKKRQCSTNKKLKLAFVIILLKSWKLIFYSRQSKAGILLLHMKSSDSSWSPNPTDLCFEFLF